MTTSSRRERSNQQNALKSTGPRTPAGKAASSANAVRHGILSRHLILPGESREEFDELLSLLLAEQKPVGTLESALVERMAIALWRQRRLVAAESAQVQLQQVGLVPEDLLRIKHITGVDDLNYIQAMAREQLPELTQLEAELDDCNKWFDESEMAAEDDLQSMPKRLPQLWKLLSEKLNVRTAKEAHEQMSEETGGGLWDWMEEIRAQSDIALKVVTALYQARQSALQPRNSDMLSRYQTNLDNDLYKAMRALREAQAYRIDQAARHAKPIDSHA